MLNFTNDSGIIITANLEERMIIMPNIKPVSDLRNYNEVLKDIAVGEPVFLTKNGRGRYALMDIEEYEHIQATLKLLGELSAGERSGRYTTLEDVEKELGV